MEIELPAANAIVDKPGYDGSQNTVTTIAAEHRYHDTIQVSMDTVGSSNYRYAE